jgi:hypothetical protein
VKGLIASLGALAVLLACGSCAQITLRKAMTDRVQKRYAALLERLEGGSNFEVRAAATALREAFESPAVVRSSPRPGDPRFEELRLEAISVMDRIERTAERFDAENLSEMRSEIAARCDACHAVFRTP